MKKLGLSLLAIIFVSSIANASCTCSCVNGQNIPICTSSIDMKPICPPIVCPIATPSIAPINSPSISPIGTSQCRQQQVYNNYTRRYEWRRLCY